MYVSPVHLAMARTALIHGQVIAYPTEAVWGVGCDPWNMDAVLDLLLLKQRPWQKGLILVASDIAQIAPLVNQLTDAQKAKLEMSWPGPVSWVLPDPDGWVPEWVRGEHNSVAVRVSNHPLVHQLCRAFGRPIVSTSANLSGKPPARSYREVLHKLSSRLDFVMPGETQGLAQPSVIRDVQTDKIFRS